MWPNPQFPADLVAFAEEILNEKLHFLYCVVWTCSDSPGLPKPFYSGYCLEYLLHTQLWWQYKVLRVILIFSNAISVLQGYFFRIKDDVIRNTTLN